MKIFLIFPHQTSEKFQICKMKASYKDLDSTSYTTKYRKSLHLCYRKFFSEECNVVNAINVLGPNFAALSYILHLHV